MDKKAIKWIVLLILVPVLCIAGKFLKDRYDFEESLKDFTPADFSDIDIYDVAKDTEEKRNKKVFKVNINTATAEELCTLDGIGEGTAAKIIAFRTDYGRFKTIEEIQLVDGIGEKTFLRISRNLTVE